DSAKIRIAQLEAKHLVAFNLKKNAEYKIKAVDAWHARFGAAERVIAAYNKKREAMRPMRLYAARTQSMRRALLLTRLWRSGTKRLWNAGICVTTSRNASRFPLLGASREQRVVQSYSFQDKLRKHGNDAAIAYATTLGVDVRHHLDAQRKAPSSFEEVFSAEPKPAVSVAHADQSTAASLDITASTNRGVASHLHEVHDTGSTIGSWFMAPKQSGNTRCSSSISSVAGASNAARRYVATDSEDSDATVTDLTHRTSTPIDRGDATEALQNFRASAAEFGDTTTDSLASFVPRSALARPVRPAQQRYGYIPAALRDSQVYVRSAQPQPSGADGLHSLLRNQPRPFFESIPEQRGDEERWEEVLDRENRTAWLGPLRRGLGNATFLTLVRNGVFGHAFGASAMQCSVANSNPNRLPASRRTDVNEPYATVTFATRADAALCIRLVNDSPGDFGVTPMGDNDAPRKLDAEWCENPHLNGKNRAPKRYIRRN
ncbi:hypothetical protein AAVH_35404, partial [Aphelenchoides avenae]